MNLISVPQILRKIFEEIVGLISSAKFFSELQLCSSAFFYITVHKQPFWFSILFPLIFKHFTSFSNEIKNLTTVRRLIYYTKVMPFCSPPFTKNTHIYIPRLLASHNDFSRLCPFDRVSFGFHGRAFGFGFDLKVMIWAFRYLVAVFHLFVEYSWKGCQILQLKIHAWKVLAIVSCFCRLFDFDVYWCIFKYMMMHR